MRAIAKAMPQEYSYEMPSQPFLAPKLVGKRFENHEIPLEFLRDFAALQELVISVAKWQFLRKHSDRARAPRGFLQDVSLRLAAVSEGSAIAKIVLSLSAAASSLFNSELGLLEDARDSIVTAIAAAEKGTPTHEHLPPEILGHFQVLGRSLRDEEAIEFSTSSSVARLTKESRRRLLEEIKDVVVTDFACIVGRIPVADNEKGTFELLVEEDKRFLSKDLAKHRETVMQAYYEYEKGGLVRLQGVWRFDKQRTLLGIEEIESIDIVEPLDVQLRMQELQQLKDGWLDGEGTGLNPVGARWVSASFHDYYPRQLMLPHLYPTLEGGVRGMVPPQGRRIT